MTLPDTKKANPVHEMGNWPFWLRIAGRILVAGYWIYNLEVSASSHLRGTQCYGPGVKHDNDSSLNQIRSVTYHTKQHNNSD